MRGRSPSICVVLAVLGAVLVAACGSGDSSSSESATTSSATSSASPAASAAPTPPPVAAPVVVQIDNYSDARPQSGLNAADIVYEYETEGGITRFSTIFFSAPNERVGPIRSAREATVKITKIWDGTLVYSGSVPYIANQLAAYGDRSVAETGGPDFRISSRPAPINLYTDGPHLSAFAAKVHAAPTSYQLWARTPVAALPPGATPALHANIAISNFEQPSFTWNAAAGGYTRTEPTGQMIDAASGKPWVIPTIVVLKVPVTVGPEVEDISGTHGLDFGIVGSGSAQVLNGGWTYTGSYTQGQSGPPTLTLANGSPMPIAPGQVLVILVRTTSTVRTTA